METGPYLPENSCNVCYWKSKRKATFYVGFLRRKTWFLFGKEKQVAQRKTRCYGRMFHGIACFAVPCQRQEILPRWRLFGAQIAPLQEDNARFLEENGGHQTKKNSCFPCCLST